MGPLQGALAAFLLLAGMTDRCVCVLPAHPWLPTGVSPTAVSRLNPCFARELQSLDHWGVAALHIEVAYVNTLDLQVMA